MVDRSCKSSGVQEFRSSGVQEFRSSGVQEFRSMQTKKTDSKVKLCLSGLGKNHLTRRTSHRGHEGGGEEPRTIASALLDSATPELLRYNPMLTSSLT
jgi:hypothetical protein